MNGDMPAERAPATDAADELLRRRLQQGDWAAYEELWCRFGHRLRRYASARLDSDQELAEDIAVQSLAAAARSIRSFNPRRSGIATWLYGIARRVLIAELRKQRRRTVVPRSAEVDIDTELEAPADADMASELADQLDAQRKVALLTRHLSDAEMEVLILHFVEEFTMKEVGRIMGRSERAVYSLLHRAKEKARERLAEDAA